MCCKTILGTWAYRQSTLPVPAGPACSYLGLYAGQKSHRKIDRHALPLREAVQHAFEREFAADAALLVSAVTHAGCLTAPLVNLNPAGFDRVRGPQAFADVMGPNIRGEAVVTVIGHTDRLGLVGPADRHQHRAEDLLARQPPVIG